MTAQLAVPPRVFPAPFRDRQAILIRGLVVLAALVAAYNFSLITLIRGLGLDSPLAYLGLVPFISLLLVVAGGLSHDHEPDIHDRYLDYIVGIPLVFAALVVIVVLPVPMSTFFWLWRLDLLSLPLFAAGALAIVFGARTLWRVKAPVAFLLLAWPIPYLFGINNWLDGFTNLTAAALRVIVRWIPVAQTSPGDGSVFTITHGTSQFLVGISSACSGANGLVGFILIGIAFIVLVHGRLLPKLAWLAGGLLLTWIFNLARIVLILAAGHSFGESFAIGGLHPFIGLLTFNLGVVAMLLSLRFFGLRMGLPGTVPPAPSTVRAEPRRGAEWRPVVQRPRVAFALVLAAALLAAPADFAMQRFELLAHDLGPPRLGQLTDKSAPLTGWSNSKIAQYDWVTRYFGKDATWDRYGYYPRQEVTFASSFVMMDVISTSDLNTFSTYGLLACYRFHNYRILEERRVDLGHGVTAHALSYYVPHDKVTWTAVYWEWPVNHGGKQRYERVILNRVDAGGKAPVAEVTQPDLLTRVGLAISDALGGSLSQRRDTASAKRVDYVVGFGRQVVNSAAVHATAPSQATAPSR
jgi:exosortase/archaeosortase family protein